MRRGTSFLSVQLTLPIVSSLGNTGIHNKRGARQYGRTTRAAGRTAGREGYRMLGRVNRYTRPLSSLGPAVSVVSTYTSPSASCPNPRT
jgi:hypothetical protein